MKVLNLNNISANEIKEYYLRPDSGLQQLVKQVRYHISVFDTNISDRHHDEALITSVLRACPKVERIDFRGPILIMWPNILASTPNLRGLVLRVGTHSSGFRFSLLDLLLAISQNCPQLRELVLENNVFHSISRALRVAVVDPAARVGAPASS